MSDFPPRYPNPWRPADFGPLKLSEDMLWNGRSVTLRVLYTTRRDPSRRKPSEDRDG